MSNTPTSSAQVAVGMNLEAERELFIQAYSYEYPNYSRRAALLAFENEPGSMWLAARRTAAPVAEGVALPPLDAEGLPPLPDGGLFYRSEVERIIAPYAERIRQLERELTEHKAARIAYASEFAPNVDGEPDVGSIHANIRSLKRELATFKGEHATQAAQSIDGPEFRALLAACYEAIEKSYMTEVLDHYEDLLIAYIDARTAGPEVPDWQPIETAPQDKMLLLAAEFDGPGDWRIKVGGFWDRKWNVFGATWTPTRWMHLPAAPKPQEDA